MSIPSFDLRGSAAHARLTELSNADGARDIRHLFAASADRFERFHLDLPGLLLDFSKQPITREVLDGLIDLATEAGIESARGALFSGQPINTTENRAVLHPALRAREGDKFPTHEAGIPLGDVLPEVLATREAMLAFSEEIRRGTVRDVVNVGIGGSDLGPAMVTGALRAYADGPRVHFVSNVDGAHMESVLAQCDPETTHFIVVSKTFSTQETMTNAGIAKAWVAGALGEFAIPRQFSAVSTNIPAAQAFGIPPSRIFGFADWVGGRYSLWGPVGLSIACSIGTEAFRALLDGARSMDRHFLDAPLHANAPVLLALINVWNREFLGATSHVILPYAQDLARFPAYLQQADMESNGKSTDRDGQPVPHPTGPVVWGEPGTNGQHAFYQLLHQGTEVHPADLIAYKSPLSKLDSAANSHRQLLSNAIAQSEALLVGRPETTVPHRRFGGNRPSTFFLFDRLDPHSIGQLIALHEHRIYVQGVLWNILSFDQWGVELGKALASQVEKQLSRTASDRVAVEKDSSTAALIRAIPYL